MAKTRESSISCPFHSAQYENLLEKPKDYFVIHHEIMLVLVLYEDITATTYKKRCFSFFFV